MKNAVVAALFAELDPPVKDRQGNDVQFGFTAHPDRSRYTFDTGLGAGWEQWDTNQDAWYYGVWVNLGDRQVLTYAEGDITLTTCATQEAMQAELRRMEEFHGPAPAHIRVINEDGSVTGFPQVRPDYPKENDNNG